MWHNIKWSKREPCFPVLWQNCSYWSKQKAIGFTQEKGASEELWIASLISWDFKKRHYLHVQLATLRVPYSLKVMSVYLQNAVGIVQYKAWKALRLLTTGALHSETEKFSPLAQVGASHEYTRCVKSLLFTWYKLLCRMLTAVQ